MYWTGVLDRCTGPVYWTGVLDRCTGPVYWTGVPDRCTWPVYWTGVPDQCTGPVYRTGVPDRCTGPVYNGQNYRSFWSCFNIKWYEVFVTFRTTLWINVREVIFEAQWCTVSTFERINFPLPSSRSLSRRQQVLSPTMSSSCQKTFGFWPSPDSYQTLRRSFEP